TADRRPAWCAASPAGSRAPELPRHPGPRRLQASVAWLERRPCATDQGSDAGVAGSGPNAASSAGPLRAKRWPAGYWRGMPGADEARNERSAGVAGDLVARTRASMEATNRRDYGEATKVFAREAVFDLSASGLGRFHGRSAIRTYLEEWIGAYERQDF